MRLCSVESSNGKLEGAVLVGERIVTFSELNANFTLDLPTSIIGVIEKAEETIPRLKVAVGRLRNPETTRNSEGGLTKRECAPHITSPRRSWG